MGEIVITGIKNSEEYYGIVPPLLEVLDALGVPIDKHSVRSGAFYEEYHLTEHDGIVSYYRSHTVEPRWLKPHNVVRRDRISFPEENDESVFRRLQLFSPRTTKGITTLRLNLGAELESQLLALRKQTSVPK